ncbi:MAG: hypothetical protein JO030_07495 [Candidatus Eremiobacteraeota bacterium]|nr:hypothetical protein [Candidatus Eremiobacteraeota bacterium]
MTVALVGVQVVLPGKALYHYGWYNVLIAALAITAGLFARGALRDVRAQPSRRGIACIVFGCALTAIAGIASGLFGPENQQIVGSPAQRLTVQGLGTLAFPLGASHGDDAPVRLVRPHGAVVLLSGRARNLGSFVVRTTMRTVVEVDARDALGNRLTVTQPTGRAFLSPVLLMEHRQNIAGFDVPFDSFNVPAAHRIVKAVLFSADQAQVLAHGTGSPAVLFAVDDEDERPLPHGIAFDAGVHSVRVGGLQLRAAVGAFPAVEVDSAPNLIATLAGGILVAGASGFTVLRRWRARYG